MLNYVWLVPFLPGMAALLIGLFGKWLRTRSGYVAIAAMLGTAVISLGCFWEILHGKGPFTQHLFTWISVGEFKAEAALLVDRLSVVMLLVVSIVGSLVFIYSTGYMKGERGYARFFSQLSLFAFSMYVLVLADNFALMFIGWEGVGLCSYLLIGYYMDKTWAADAGRKAFIVNRVGDFGFLLAIFLIFWTSGSIAFTNVFAEAPHIYKYGAGAITAITLLLFMGAVGKSAQIPLFIWLPDAMAGPTPVSALIHAATMVTAGVYMVARCNVLYSLAPTSMEIVAIIGAATAFVAASIGITQRDIKRVLAYSTISQLGYMFLALGVGAFAAGIFHIFTHAFFKGCLFLCAGCVIHAMAGDQDMFNMGGLRTKMKITWLTYFAATLAISGFPLTAGFFSKDEILWATFSSGHLALWLVGLVAAFMTAFYMFRSLFLTFHGENRAPEEVKKHIHEMPANMTLPLIILAFFSLVAGFLGVPQVLKGSDWFDHFLHPVTNRGAEVVHELNVTHTAPHVPELELLLMAASILIVLIGIFAAYAVYVKGWPERARAWARRLGPLYQLSFNKWWWDDLYNSTFVQGILRLAKVAWQFDIAAIDGVINGIAYIIRTAAGRLRKLQTGQLQAYGLGMLIGINLIVLIFLLAR
jgi:NADH-quinone oxidoreductase subunit L